jgi:hypothetical protein
MWNPEKLANVVEDLQTDFAEGMMGYIYVLWVVQENFDGL